MSDQPTFNLKTLLEESGLLEKAVQLEESLYQLQAGSAMVVVGVKGRALVIISPMFKGPPDDNKEVFYRRLLELNSTLGGVANFAIQPDGWIVMNGGRDVQGMDADEFGTLIGAVAGAADHFDNQLLDEFYSHVTEEEAAADSEGEEAAAAGESDDDGEADDKGEAAQASDDAAEADPG